MTNTQQNESFMEGHPPRCGCRNLQFQIWSTHKVRHTIWVGGAKNENLIIFFYVYNLLKFWGRSWRSGTRCDCETNWLWVRSPLEEMKYLFKFIFPFLRSGVKAKCGVEFRYSCNESGERSILTLGSLCLPCCVRDRAWSWFYDFIS